MNRYEIQDFLDGFKPGDITTKGRKPPNRHKSNIHQAENPATIGNPRWMRLPIMIYLFLGHQCCVMLAGRCFSFDQTSMTIILGPK